MNYLSAAHLTYVGQSERALPLLKRAVEGGYCSYPGMDSDPMLAGVRSRAAFAEIRAEGMACQQRIPEGSGEHAGSRAAIGKSSIATLNARHGGERDGWVQHRRIS